MQQLDGWHLASALGNLDAVAQQHRPTAGAVHRKQLLGVACPMAREAIEIDRRRVCASNWLQAPWST